MTGNRLILAGLVAGVSAMIFGLTRCSNNPYVAGESASRTLYSFYDTAPSKLDPASSYYEHEALILANLCEAPLDYHYLKRPYELIPRTVTEVPEPAYFDADGNRLEGDPPAERVARAEYVFRIKPGIQYADHPCFAKDGMGNPRHRGITDKALDGLHGPADLPEKGTRELTAEDYVRGIRRLADPRYNCPIFSTLERYILGMKELAAACKTKLEEERARRPAGWREDEAPILVDYMTFDCPGVTVVDRHTFKITLQRKYPQILYWMTMQFFSPVPREVEEFYAEPALARRRFNFNTWPMGTGAFYLQHCEPNRKIVLQRNPHYRPDPYPSEGEPADGEKGLLAAAGQPMPFVDRVVLFLEKETIPAWNKFLQGYYDRSGITAEAFDKAINMANTGVADVTEDMRRRGISLDIELEPSTRWIYFNMLDDVVGGYSEQKAKLRRAITIAFDFNEYLDIFFNGRGITAQGPLAPGIFGWDGEQATTNPYTDVWNPQLTKNVRKPIEEARRLLVEAGYPDGRTPDGRPLVLYFDHAMGGEPIFVAQFSWMRRQLAQLGIDLRERGTDLRRFREKMDQGNYQMCISGWNADYPDPENFLFLFYGPNSKARGGGENYSNYSSAEFDRMFEQMESMLNGPERRAIIDRMVDLVRREAPCCWCFHFKRYTLQHQWLRNSKTSMMVRNAYKYRAVDPDLRTRLQSEWNRPRVLPMAAILVALVALAAPVILRRGRKGTPS